MLPLRSFGKTGLRVSPLGFGAMRLPLIKDEVGESRDASQIDEAAATKMIRTAIDGGVNYLDTAYVYHSKNFPEAGASETFLAKVLADGYREKIILATKLPLWHIHSRADMDKYLDEQLSRLQTRQIDVYFAHNFNATTWTKMRDLGIADFFTSAKKNGRIKHAAFSFHDHYSLFAEIVAAYDWEATLLQHNYLDYNQQAGERGLELAAKNNLGVAIMEPLRGGFLVNQLPTEVQAAFRSARPDWTFAEWGLRYLWMRPEIGTVLSGMGSLAQVEENLRSAEKPLDFGERETAAINEARRIFGERLKVNCTSCGYCLPCPRGVAIPKIFHFYNDLFLGDAADLTGQNRARTFYASTLTEDQLPERCVKCGICESRCPQKIAIISALADAAKAFAK